MDKLKKIAEENRTLIISLAIAFVFFGILFGFTGLMFFAGISILGIPVYLIINLFKLEKMEKLILFFPLSIAIYPSFVYYLAFLFSSIKIATIVTFVILIVFYIVIVKLKSKKLIKNDALILIGLFALVIVFWLVAKFTVINAITQPQYVESFVDCLQSNTLEFCNNLY